MITIDIMNARVARASGYHALTSTFQLPNEQGMLDNILADLRRGKIDHVLVRDGCNLAIWRRPLRAATMRTGQLRTLPRAAGLKPVVVLKSGRRRSAVKGTRK